MHALDLSHEMLGELSRLASERAASLLLMRERLGEDEWQRRSLRSQAFLERGFAGATREVEATAWFGIGHKAG